MDIATHVSFASSLLFVLFVSFRLTGYVSAESIIEGDSSSGGDDLLY